MPNVIVDYNDFSKDNSNVEKIEFDLLPNTTLVLSQVHLQQETEGEGEGDEPTGKLSITMIDKGTEEVEISGELDNETLNALIRSLNIFRNQINSEDNK